MGQNIYQRAETSIYLWWFYAEGWLSPCPPPQIPISTMAKLWYLSTALKIFCSVLWSCCFKCKPTLLKYCPIKLKLFMGIYSALFFYQHSRHFFEYKGMIGKIVHKKRHSVDVNTLSDDGNQWCNSKIRQCLKSCMNRINKLVGVRAAWWGQILSSMCLSCATFSGQIKEKAGGGRAG